MCVIPQHQPPRRLPRHLPAAPSAFPFSPLPRFYAASCVSPASHLIYHHVLPLRNAGARQGCHDILRVYCCNSDAHVSFSVRGKTSDSRRTYQLRNHHQAIVRRLKPLSIAHKDLIMDGETHVSSGVRPHSCTELATDGEIRCRCQGAGDTGVNSGLDAMRIGCRVDERQWLARCRDAYEWLRNTVDRWRVVHDANNSITDEGISKAVELQRM